MDENARSQRRLEEICVSHLVDLGGLVASTRKVVPPLLSVRRRGERRPGEVCGPFVVLC